MASGNEKLFTENQLLRTKLAAIDHDRRQIWLAYDEQRRSNLWMKQKLVEFQTENERLIQENRQLRATVLHERSQRKIEGKPIWLNDRAIKIDLTDEFERSSPAVDSAPNIQGVPKAANTRSNADLIAKTIADRNSGANDVRLDVVAMVPRNQPKSIQADVKREIMDCEDHRESKMEPLTVKEEAKSFSTDDGLNETSIGAPVGVATGTVYVNSNRDEEDKSKIHSLIDNDSPDAAMDAMDSNDLGNTSDSTIQDGDNDDESLLEMARQIELNLTSCDDVPNEDSNSVIIESFSDISGMPSLPAKTEPMLTQDSPDTMISANIHKVQERPHQRAAIPSVNAVSIDLKRQFEIQSNEKPFRCKFPECGKRFRKEANLASHKQKHMGKYPLHHCEFPGCEKSFAQKSSLTSHKQVHAAEKPYRCRFPKCEKSFGKKYSLTNHSRIHTGETPFRCDAPQCGKAFSQRKSLTAHKKIHLRGEASALVDVHKRIHGGPERHRYEYPGSAKKLTPSIGHPQHERSHVTFRCMYPGCEKTFSQMDVLDQHKQCHLKPYVCRRFGCKAKFEAKLQLLLHTREEHKR